MENKQKITLTRIFDASIEKVWDMWTTPSLFAAWYGKPWEVPPESVEMDVRVDGRWKSITIAHGNTIHFTAVYREVEKPKKLVFAFQNPDDIHDPNIELVTVVLEETGDGKTKMVFTQAGNLPAEEYDTGLRKGWGGFFDHIEKHLTEIITK